jgi:hypothetical protein
MRTLLAAAASALAITLAATGCAPAHYETTTYGTEGDKGALTFEYDACLFGCGLDRPALQGSAVTLEVKGGAADAALVARLAGGAAATISNQNYSCTAADCRLFVTVETKDAGEAKVEVTDKSGKLVDGAVLHVRPAARIDVEVRGRTAGADGVHAVREGEKLAVKSTVLAADGAELIFSYHGVSQTYADESIVGPDEGVVLGATDVEDALAKKAGDTSLAIRAVGAETVVRFRVTK